MNCNSAKVKAWEDTLMIPTYEVGPEDRNPPLLMRRRNPIHPGSSIVYPYPLQETLYNRKQDRRWRVFYIENDYLKLAVLPEMGGRLLYVYDKSAGQEAIYHNQVLKYARIGIRGAWVSGGIEWNFPNGHTVTSSSPIDCALRENPDGSATLLLSDIERVSRMRWSVGITLFPERAFFETEIRLNNRTFFPNRFWFWSNSAAPVSPGMEYIATATKVMTLKGMMNFPVHEGVDIHWDRNHVEAQDMFCLNPREQFVGWYNHDLKKGMVNVADRSEARGTKFYTWGNSDDGDIWEGRLTDADGPYAEMQSGRLPTMGIWEILSPYSQESWKEVWYPLTQIGAPSFANREAAFNVHLVAGAQKLALAVVVTSPQPKAQLTLAIDRKTVWQERADLLPGKPFIAEVPLQGKKFPGKETSVSLYSAEGILLAQRVLRGEGEPELEVKGILKVQPNRPSARAEDHWLNGIDFEKLGDYDQARAAYEKALDNDPEFSPAQVSLAVLLLRQGRNEEAAQKLREVVEKSPGHEEARFYLGVCLLNQEKLFEAGQELKVLLRSRLYRAGSAYLLGGLYLGQGEPAKAVEQLRKTDSPEAKALLACGLRHGQKPGEARAALAAILQEDPLNFMALGELYFLALETRQAADVADAKKKLQSSLRDEAQSYLELAAEYARFGLYAEASQILALCWETATGARTPNPMVGYHLGYYAEKLGKKEAKGHYEQAAKAGPEFVFPHRLESEVVLRRALEADPADARAGYYLGNLLCAKGRVEEAVKLWEEAAPRLKGFSVVHRNLGRAYWKARRDPDRAIRHYEQALACDPADYKLYFELNRILLTCGLEERRKRLVEKIPPQLMENDVIAELVAAFHADAGDFDRTLEILKAGYFYPWEVYKGVRLLYADANIGRGIVLMRQGKFKEAIESMKEVFQYPRNIGVGEPFCKANAEALYWIGLAQERSGDTMAALQSWQQAAEEERPVWNDLCYYKARAMLKLGQQETAVTVLQGLLEFARKKLEEGGGDRTENLYLSGLARKGLGDTVQAFHDFRAALAVSSAHRRCRWEMSGFTAE